MERIRTKFVYDDGDWVEAMGDYQDDPEFVASIDWKRVSFTITEQRMSLEEVEEIRKEYSK